MKFYKGQLVKITNDTCAHGFEIGSIVTLESVHEVVDNDWDLWSGGWVFGQDDCIPVDDIEEDE